jgi:hypothetical protein
MDNLRKQVDMHNPTDRPAPGAMVPERALAATSRASQTLLDTYRAYLKHTRTCGACANLRVICETGRALWQAHTTAQAAMRPSR